MSEWINFSFNWFNVKDFCHIWIDESVNGYFAMGEWRHNGEEVVLTGCFEKKEDVYNFINHKLKNDI